MLGCPLKILASSSSAKGLREGPCAGGAGVWAGCNEGHCKGQGEDEHDKPVPHSLPPRITALRLVPGPRCLWWPRGPGDPVHQLHHSPVPMPLQSAHSQELASSPTAEQSWCVPREPQELQSRSLQGLGEQQNPLSPKAPELWGANSAAALSPPPPCSLADIPG